ncbi:EscJ/YscJ/HrcJ family type III secretion inner membrane ring protein [Phyllobacterium salinisoli]|uniref:Lipoprotein n=1 Tax=Phyllobacterium salinisoli TaxID=1899321 RepID=A0A368JWM3_9HYPH|nr:type III secretion inner membrane ring lipoprotein SctJ [Phyllobacterium salinisoli]RCS21559.1 EscJ/YscJ/HrcJ family type III secretion inner membrane ring protein [Phyllobacterium salinisoli]
MNSRNFNIINLLLALCISALILSGCKMEMNSGLEEKEANEMLGQLLLHDINASKQVNKDKTISLWIEKDQFAQAEYLMRNLGLPRRPRMTMEQIFKSDGLIPSPVEEWAKLNYAKTEGLSRMIASIPGVVSAEIDLANPQRKESFEKVLPPSASVIVTVFKDSINPELIPQIKQLIAFSIENITYDRVSVVVAPVERPKKQPAETMEVWGVKLFKNSYLTALGMLAGVAMLTAFLTAITYYGVIIIRRRKRSKSNDNSAR